MKLFPSSSYEYRLQGTPDEALSRLRRETEITGTLTPLVSGKSFRGRVDGDVFRIVSSGIGHGGITVLSGRVNSEKGVVLVEINKAFKALFAILCCIYFIFLIFGMLKGMELSWTPIAVAILFFAVFRFIFIEFAFRRYSKRSIRKLGNVLNTESMNKT